MRIAILDLAAGVAYYEGANDDTNYQMFLWELRFIARDFWQDTTVQGIRSLAQKLMVGSTTQTESVAKAEGNIREAARGLKRAALQPRYEDQQGDLWYYADRLLHGEPRIRD